MTKGGFRSSKLAEVTSMFDLFEAYHDKVSPTKRGGDVEQIRLKVLMASPLAKYSVKNLTPEVMAKWRDDRLTEVSGSTVGRELTLIAHVIEKARKEWGMELAENPAHVVSRPKQAPHRERRLRGDEEARLLDAADKTHSKVCPGYLHQAIILAVETAMRQAEIAELRWEFINLKDRVIRLRPTVDFHIKNDSARTIPLSLRAVAALTAAGEKTTGQVFKGVTPEGLKRAFIRTTERAEIEDLTFHDLRHEATSRLFEKGLNIGEVKQITGHKTMSALERYVHMDVSKIAHRLD